MTVKSLSTSYWSPHHELKKFQATPGRYARVSEGSNANQLPRLAPPTHRQLKSCTRSLQLITTTWQTGRGDCLQPCKIPGHSLSHAHLCRSSVMRTPVALATSANNRRVPGWPEMAVTSIASLCMCHTPMLRSALSVPSMQHYIADRWETEARQRQARPQRDTTE